MHIITWVNFQGAFVLLVVTIGWTWAAFMRRKERLRRQPAFRSSRAKTKLGSALEVTAEAGEYAKSSKPNQPAELPGVSIILPVKGCRTHSISNWQSHTSVWYPGPIEYVFALESSSDPAYEALQQLQQNLLAERPIRLLVCGLAKTCSQKAHNLATAAAACSPQSKYVLFLDDDVELHPQTVRDLVQVMESDPELFMATGYPFDVPPSGAGLLSFCVLVYHLPLLIAFSVSEQTQFVWGGCMMLRNEHLKSDRYEILQSWKNGGYSDDLILASICTKQGLKIATPSFAIFPQWLDKQYTWSQYWNYLRRQLYVLDTYVDAHNKFVNHTMMLVHSWASFAFAAALLSEVAGLVYLLTSVITAVFTTPTHADDAPGSTTSVSTGTYWGAVHRLMLQHLTKEAAGTKHSTYLLDSHIHAGNNFAPVSCKALSYFILTLSIVLAQLALVYLVNEVLMLFRVLNPKMQLITLRQFSWWKIWLAFLIENAVLPFCMLLTYISPEIVWSGVEYVKTKGKVARKVDHTRN